MADQPVVHVGENSPEQVAFKLMLNIARVEGRVLQRNPEGGQETASKEWILDTYAECLRIVKNPIKETKK